MDKRSRTRLLLGIILIIAGAWFFLAQFYPQLAIWEDLNLTWPWIVIGVGLLLYFLGLLGGEPDMMVPATVVTGIGGILYYQQQTGDWGSWAYAWALIPGFVGIGVFLAGLLKGNLRSQLKDAFTLILISLILFAIFGSFLGGLEWAGIIGAVALILLGLYIVVSNLVKPQARIKSQKKPVQEKPVDVDTPIPPPSPSPGAGAGEEADK
jgi:hypothetical protein